ncbi:MAG: DUF4974 domain-containing protein [Chlorobi bacterium]|nr:DUF4974 domain-containing protein [Chlorobiota bacterium]
MNIKVQNNMRFEDDSSELFSRLKIPWKQTKDEVWKNLSERLHTIPVIQMKPKVAYWQIAAAAVIIVSLTLGVFMKSYTVTKQTLAAQTFNAELPDGSNVILNAGSQISYKPYWWWAKRKVKLQGEAFFKVKKGKTFSVESIVGTTRVLGTTFNIYSRGQHYEVTCVTGKVKVQDNNTKKTVVLLPAQKVSLQKTGELKVEKNVNTDNVKAWMSDRLVFTSLPLNEVFDEIERQYNVEVITPEGLTMQYTGSFYKTESAENALRLICRPFELKVEKKGNNQFLISN